MSALVTPCERLVSSLSALTGSMEAGTASGSFAARWQRALAHVRRELDELKRPAGSLQAAQPQGSAKPDYAGLERAALRLTQLARTLDGVGAGTAAETSEFNRERQAVVFAAWHLLQALEAHAALHTGTAR